MSQKTLLVGKSQGRSLTVITAEQGVLGSVFFKFIWIPGPFRFSPPEGAAAAPTPLAMPRRMGSSCFSSPVPGLSGKGSPYGPQGTRSSSACPVTQGETAGSDTSRLYKSPSVRLQDFPFLGACLPTGVLSMEAHRDWKFSP